MIYLLFAFFPFFTVISDWFVAPPLPLMGIYAAVTRSTLDGANPEGWVPEQKITVEDALRKLYDKCSLRFL